MKVYVASSLKNIAIVQGMNEILRAEGHEITYDWTEHGPCPERIADVAVGEAQGVRDADVVVVLLPGGKGTHFEMGVALGLRKPIILSGDVDFKNPDQDHCSFWHHPAITRVPYDTVAIRAVLNHIEAEKHRAG